MQLTEAQGKLAGARVVRDGYQVMLISTGGTVIRMPVEDIKRLGRSTQGVIVMRLRGDEQVSSLAPVVESEGSDAAVEAAADGGRGGRDRAARRAGLRRGRLPAAVDEPATTSSRSARDLLISLLTPSQTGKNRVYLPLEGFRYAPIKGSA